MQYLTSYIFVILILSVLSDIASCKPLKTQERDTRSANNGGLPDPGFSYGYGYGFDTFQPDLSSYPGYKFDYPYEAGVYYNYPHQHDVPVLQGGFDYNPARYPYQPDFSGGYYPGYQPNYNPGGPGYGIQPGVQPGVYPSVSSVTPVPYDPEYPGYASRPVTPGYYNYPGGYQAGVINNQPTIGPNLLLPGSRGGHKPLNRVPLGVNPGKSSGDLPQPSLSWQIPNRQF